MSHMYLEEANAVADKINQLAAHVARGEIPALENIKDACTALEGELSDHMAMCNNDFAPHSHRAIDRRTRKPTWDQVHSRHYGYRGYFGGQRESNLFECKQSFIKMVEKLEPMLAPGDDHFQWLAQKLVNRLGILAQYVPQNQELAQAVVNKFPNGYWDYYFQGRAEQLSAAHPAITLPKASSPAGPTPLIP